MRRNYPTKLMAALAIAGLLTMSGCTNISELAIPTLPPLPVAEAASPEPSADASPTAAPTASPMPSETPDPKPSLFPFPTPPELEPEATAAATADPTAEPTAEPQAAAQSDVYATSYVYEQTPTLSITGETLPTDMLQHNTATLHGTINTDCGVITAVTGQLVSSAGDIVQQCSYYPESSSFSLAGTVNYNLRFAQLSPDTYSYQIIASAENGAACSSCTLIDHSFTVSSASSAAGASSSSGASYTAKLTSDTSNAGLIWNYFINQFNNPYAAAAILGNISTESGCNPCRVEGDLSSSHAFSLSYTTLVDTGAVSRDTFVKYKPGDKYGQGYGLCQWSYDRKGNLYDLAVSRGSSVGDLGVQCDFIMQELTNNYPKLLEYLKTAGDAEAAALEFCNVYEQAAVHGGRTTLAKEYLKTYAS